MNISWNRHGDIKVDKTLVEILGQYSTDKLNSGFGEFYEELFKPIRHSTESVLEIGIAQGGSLRAWRDYFPHAVIFGIDKELQFVEPFLSYHARIYAYHEDAGNLALWAKGRYFDVIIDDGSHFGDEIIEAFTELWPTVNPRGYYIIEDVASSRPDYRIVFDYFTDIARAEILYPNKNEITFRHNMIVLQKK